MQKGERENKEELSRERTKAGEDMQHKCKQEHMIMHDISST